MYDNNRTNDMREEFDLVFKVFTLYMKWYILFENILLYFLSIYSITYSNH